MKTMDYWLECASSALDDAGVQATDEQLNTIARVIEGGAEQEHMAHQTPEGDDELELIKAELKKEQNKRGCTACKGQGYETVAVGHSHYSKDTCGVCHGAGKA